MAATKLQSRLRELQVLDCSCKWEKAKAISVLTISDGAGFLFLFLLLTLAPFRQACLFGFPGCVSAAADEICWLACLVGGAEECPGAEGADG